MANSIPGYPFVAFSFSVEISAPGASSSLCAAAFSECDGLEVGMEVKTIREGGNNMSQVRLAGPTVLGTLTLKRGMSSNFDLWTWVSAALANPGLRYDASVVVTSPQNGTTLAHFVLARCLPQKLKAPPLNAKDGGVAIEELQVAYESLTFRGQS